MTLFLGEELVKRSKFEAERHPEEAVAGSVAAGGSHLCHGSCSIQFLEESKDPKLVKDPKQLCYKCSGGLG